MRNLLNSNKVTPTYTGESFSMFFYIFSLAIILISSCILKCWFTYTFHYRFFIVLELTLKEV